MQMKVDILKHEGDAACGEEQGWYPQTCFPRYCGWAWRPRKSVSSGGVGVWPHTVVTGGSGFLLQLLWSLVATTETCLRSPRAAIEKQVAVMQACKQLPPQTLILPHHSGCASTQVSQAQIGALPTLVKQVATWTTKVMLPCHDPGDISSADKTKQKFVL